LSDSRVFEIIIARHYEIERSRLVLSDILGVGQFGDVFRGVYQETVKSDINAIFVPREMYFSARIAAVLVITMCSVTKFVGLAYLIRQG